MKARRCRAIETQGCTIGPELEHTSNKRTTHVASDLAACRIGCGHAPTREGQVLWTPGRCRSSLLRSAPGSVLGTKKQECPIGSQLERASKQEVRMNVGSGVAAGRTGRRHATPLESRGPLAGEAPAVLAAGGPGLRLRGSGATIRGRGTPRDLCCAARRSTSATRSGGGPPSRRAGGRTQQHS